MHLHTSSHLRNVRPGFRAFPHSLGLIGLQLLIIAIWMLAIDDVMAQASYPHMAPLSNYLRSNASSEVALARSAAPASISGDAEILTLGPRGYSVAAQGSNGFVCLVERSWDHRISSAEFWNPQHRIPICYNPKAARTVLPIYLQRTRWVLSGMHRAEMAKRTRAEAASNGVSVPRSGAMAFMMSKEQNICSAQGGCTRWYPHLMFFFPSGRLPDWGSNLKGVPVFSGGSTTGMTLVFVLVPKWADQTPSPAAK